jgi:hypothetical protein
MNVTGVPIAKHARPLGEISQMGRGRLSACSSKWPQDRDSRRRSWMLEAQAAL